MREPPSDVYEALARHLDGLPGGFPKTESGVELRILQRLFTCHEAELAVHLSLIPEEAYVIAFRAGISRQEAASSLATMAKKGLIYSIHRNGSAPQYQAAQFAVGIWEYQVNRMDEAFVRDMDEYWPVFFNLGNWQAMPQLRTIPIHESVNYSHDIMPYEQAAAMIGAHDRIAVAPCVCRQDRAIAGKPCEKPEETCLTFDGGADYYIRDGRGRAITQAEALDIVRNANEVGLVLQPSNSRTASFICCCCGCCCGVLRNLKQQPNPAELVISAHVAALDPESCIGCGRCLERCEMDALDKHSTKVSVLTHRCIGCGLCVTTCPTGALTLNRKPSSDQPRIPRTMAHTVLRLAHARGKLGPIDLIKMVVKSQWHRLVGRRVD